MSWLQVVLLSTCFLGLAVVGEKLALKCEWASRQLVMNTNATIYQLRQAEMAIAFIQVVEL